MWSHHYYFTMLDNHVYNLLLQLTQEHKSLWRIQRHYLDDAGDCASCKKFWQKMKTDKEQHVEELRELIREHFRQ